MMQRRSGERKGGPGACPGGRNCVPPQQDPGDEFNASVARSLQFFRHNLRIRDRPPPV